METDEKLVEIDEKPVENNWTNSGNQWKLMKTDGNQ